MPMASGGFTTEAAAEAEAEAESAAATDHTGDSPAIKTRTRPPRDLPTNPTKSNIPQAARLPFFFNNWKQVTNNNWVLRVVKEGYKLQFDSDPPPS